MTLNALLSLPVMTKSAIFDGKMAVTNLLIIFAKCITAKGTKEEEDKLEEEEEDKDAVEGEDTENNSKDSAKDSAETLDRISANCNNILAFV